MSPIANAGYDTDRREYLVGTVDSDYYYDPVVIEGFRHLRRVRWEGRVSRDRLSVAARNSLGSILPLFAVDEEAWASIVAALSAKESEATLLSIPNGLSSRRRERRRLRKLTN